MSTLPLPPQRISHYRLVEILGRGAMGEVWLAEDTDLPRQVAIKLLPSHVAEEEGAVTRFLREAQAAASIDHPSVVTVYEAGQVEGRPYIVMQRLEGETLAARMERGPLPVAEALSVATQIVDALAEVHALGIVHRDLKPSNVMLTARGAKILDFGVASAKALPRMTLPGSLVGTPATMSPEQIRGLPPDNRSDLWAVGVILYEMLTGEAPFQADSRDGLFHQILHDRPSVPSTLRSGIEPDIDYIIQKLLRKDVDRRYLRAEDVHCDLTSCAAPSVGGTALEERGVVAPRLAVLPFDVLSPDPDDGFLASGLTEDLIVDLARVDGLRVASRAEVAPYAERSVPPRTLARELGVDYALLGSVRRAGNRARINAQLVRSSDGHTLWAERFDRTLDDLFDVQAEVSRRIVEALQLALKPDEIEMLDRAPTKVPEAYTLYLKARDLISRSPEENRRAALLLKEAVELDTDFALGYAALGLCYAERALKWWGGGVDLAAPARECAQRALELEPGLPEAYRVELMAHRLDGNAEQALQSIERLIATGADDPETLEWVGWSYMSLGRGEDALPILERASANHPENVSLYTHLSNCYGMLGREEDVGRTNRRMCEVILDILQRDPGRATDRSRLGAALVRQGEHEAGIEQVRRSVAIAPRDGQIRYNAACAYALAGHPERALAELQEGTKDLPNFAADWPSYDPDLESLRDHPEFRRMFRLDET